MNVKELNTLSSDCLCLMSVRLCLSDTEQSEWIQGVEWGMEYCLPPEVVGAGLVFCLI